jgi:hypothetical protein
MDRRKLGIFCILRPHGLFTKIWVHFLAEIHSQYSLAYALLPHHLKSCTLRLLYVTIYSLGVNDISDSLAVAE